MSRATRTRPAWETPGTRWQYADGRWPERVFVVERLKKRSLRVRCRVESPDAAHGLRMLFPTSDFHGRKPVLMEVGEQLSIEDNDASEVAGR